MTKHTQGPWEWDGNVWDYDDHQEAPWLVQAPWTAKESQTVLTGSIKCKSEADARLIAAAPELLEALKWTLARVERLAPHSASEGDAALYEIAAAMSAIAKAEGTA